MIKNDLEKGYITFGTRVRVDLRDASGKNEYLSKRLMHGEIVPFITGYVKRIASNGALGIEFDIRVTKLVGEDIPTLPRNVYNLHGTGRMGYCLYFKPDDVIYASVEVRPQGDIAQSMEDTMLDEEYGVSDEHDFIVGF